VHGNHTILINRSHGTSSGMYRADVDGLRAIAVVPVLLYHAQVWPFTGGYVGVDIFFVISGYLIASLLVREIDDSEFSIALFYKRRIRRIFPALFSVVLFSIVVGYFLFMPLEFKRLAESTVAISVFASNVLFWLTSGYFDGDASLKPLLHTWSLAVEEQFYVVFPFLLFFVLKVARQRAVTIFAILALISFALSILQISRDSAGAFYLLSSRAWELILGVLLALRKSRTEQSLLTENTLGTIGILMILWSVFTFSEKTSFPGWNALLPSLGAAFVLRSGACSQTFVARALSAPTLVFIGLISYSLYLWHWPLIVFAKYYLMQDLNWRETAVILILSTVTAVISWRFVEIPFRKRSSISRQSYLPTFGSAAVVTVLSLSVGLLVYFSQGFPQRLPQDVRILAMGALDTDAGKTSCDSKPMREIRAGHVCELGYLAAPTSTFAVLGDSIAISLLPAVDAAASEAQQKGAILTRGGCYPALGVRPLYDTKNIDCDEYPGTSIAYIKSHPSIISVIIVARWTAAAEGTVFGGKDLFIADKYSMEAGYDENKRVFSRTLEQTITALAGRKIFIVLSVPEHFVDVARMAAMSKYLGRPVRLDVSREDFDVRQSFVRKTIYGMAERLHFRVIDVGSRLCNQSSCIAIKDGHSLYVDGDHLSKFGALEVRDLFRPIFENEQH
jgi:peptidoglycan/LPS O-acetylase OafA/YrhL